MASLRQLSAPTAPDLGSVVSTVLPWAVAALVLLALAFLLVTFLRRAGSPTSPADRLTAEQPRPSAPIDDGTATTGDQPPA
jgi:hypothetical protein